MSAKARSKKNPDWIDWKGSEAKKTLLRDLTGPDGILFKKNHLTAELVWEKHYKNQPGFEKVVLSQFKERLKDHRSQVDCSYAQQAQESAALAHDRVIFPRESKNSKGQPVFDLSPAKPLLRADVKNKAHENLTPSQFQQTRKEYMQFEPAVFTQQI